MVWKSHKPFNLIATCLKNLEKTNNGIKAWPSKFVNIVHTNSFYKAYWNCGWCNSLIPKVIEVLCQFFCPKRLFGKSWYANCTWHFLLFWHPLLARLVFNVAIVDEKYLFSFPFLKRIWPIISWFQQSPCVF